MDAGYGEGFGGYLLCAVAVGLGVHLSGSVGVVDGVDYTKW